MSRRLRLLVNVVTLLATVLDQAALFLHHRADRLRYQLQRKEESS